MPDDSLSRVVLVTAAIGLHKMAFACAGADADERGRACTGLAANFLGVQLAATLAAAARFAFQFKLRTRTSADHRKNS